MPGPPTNTGLTTLLLLPALYVALKLWGVFVARRIIRALPIFPETFTVVTDGEVPADSREILEAHAAPLEALDFVRVGYVRVTDGLVPDARARLVLRHRVEPAFALVGFGLLGQELGVFSDLLTRLEDGSWVVTENGRNHHRSATPPGTQLGDAFVATFSEQWQAHRASYASYASSSRPAASFELADLVTYLDGVDPAMLRVAAERGEVVLEGEPPRGTRTALGARRTIERLTAGMRRAVAAKLTRADFRAVRLPIEDQQRIYAENALVRELRRRAASPALVLGVTAVGFALSIFLTLDVTWLVLLMPAVLFHELGHWTVMRLCGHRDARIAFVPFFGAVTMTQKPFAKRWQEVAMLLAGPLPGLVLGLVLSTMGAQRHWDRVMHAGLMLVGLNALNLLPLQPLDGGRIFHVLVAAGRPALDLALRALATAVFIGVALALQEPTLGLVGLAGIFVLRAGYRNLALEKKIRAAPDYDPRWPEAERRRRVFAALSESPQRRLAQWFEAALALDLQVRTRRPPLWQALFWVAALGAVVGGFVSLNNLGKRVSAEFDCPPIERAQRVSCDDAPAFASIDWRRASMAEVAGPPTPGAPRSRRAAFVWCESDDPAALGTLMASLGEAAAVAPFCGALPWEEPVTKVPAALRANARKTLARVTMPYATLGDVAGQRLSLMDRITDYAKKEKWFDAETARLAREFHDPATTNVDGVKRALGERIGRSPSGACDALVIRNVEPQHGPRDAGAARDARAPREASADVSDDDDDDEGPIVGLRFSAELATPEAFAPLGAYLCRAGCRLRVTPWPAGAKELELCF